MVASQDNLFDCAVSGIRATIIFLEPVAESNIDRYKNQLLECITSPYEFFIIKISASCRLSSIGVQLVEWLRKKIAEQGHAVAIVMDRSAARLLHPTSFGRLL